MSSINEGTCREDVVRSALLHYIKNGLARDITSQNMTPYRHMRLASLNDGVASVIIGGADPQTNSTISRDVFIDGFVRVFVRPIILGKFPDVNTVEYINTADDRFDGIVENLGGTVEYADFWELGHTYHECMLLFGDNSPLVQGFLKATFPKIHNNNPESSNNSVIKYTTTAFFEKWSLGWFVTDETHVLAIDGSVYWGIIQIKEHRHLLPNHLHLVETEMDDKKWVLIASSSEFFQNSNFKVIDF